VAQVSREPLSLLYSTSATLRARQQATVTARTRGVLEKLLVEEGAEIGEGQALATLEDEEQQIEFDRTVATRDTRLRELARAEELHGRGLVSDEVHETARRMGREAEQAAALAELALSRTVIRAPFGGRILKRHVDAGASVSDGTPIYDLADIATLHADVTVPERQVSKLALGQTVRLVPEATDRSFEARIERIAPVVDPATGTVKVTLAAASAEGLRPGGFVRVEIVTDTHPRSLVVPRSALVAEGRRWHLFRLKADGAAVEKVEVRPGYEEGDRVEILGADGTEAGLEPGTPVVVVGASALTDGARVDVAPDDPAAGEGAPPAAALGGPTCRGVRVVAA
jgi:membrane fusion protein (multidrug efflux system)